MVESIPLEDVKRVRCPREYRGGGERDGGRGQQVQWGAWVIVQLCGRSALHRGARKAGSMPRDAQYRYCDCGVCDARVAPLLIFDGLFSLY